MVLLSNSSYSKIFLGEKEERVYKGPSLDNYPYPSNIERPGKGDFFLDGLYQNNFTFQSISDEVLALRTFWRHDFLVNSDCPLATFKKNEAYIRYLFRLLSISYLYESLKVHYGYEKKIRSKNQSCEISPKRVFANCKPQSTEMNGFVGRLEKLTKKGGRYKTFKKKIIRKLMNVISGMKKRDGTLGILQNTYQLWCRENSESSCDKLDNEKVEKILSWGCQNIREDIEIICSEKDSLYGLHNIKEMELLLEFSHVLGKVNQGGFQRKCLKRFIEVFKGQEVSNDHLNGSSSMILENLRKKEKRYLQGELFLYGSLQGFEKKGLGDFLIKSSSLKDKKGDRNKKSSSKENLKIVLKNPPKRTKKESNSSDEKKLKKFKIKGSQFKKTSYVLKKTGMERIPLNMKKFKGDFLFNEDVSLRLKVQFAEFEDFTFIKKLKDERGFGSKELPVLLLYLKFLIEHKRHLGLYNMTNVLGNRFYILNDLDDENKPELIELRNDEKTNWDWQIFLLKPGA